MILLINDLGYYWPTLVLSLRTKCTRWENQHKFLNTGNFLTKRWRGQKYTLRIWSEMDTPASRYGTHLCQKKSSSNTTIIVVFDPKHLYLSAQQKVIDYGTPIYEQNPQSSFWSLPLFPQCGPGPTYDRSAWMDVKFTLGLDFPNLPYYMEKNVISFLSNAWTTFEDKFPGCNAQNK